MKNPLFPQTIKGRISLGFFAGLLIFLVTMTFHSYKVDGKQEINYSNKTYELQGEYEHTLEAISQTEIEIKQAEAALNSLIAKHTSLKQSSFFTLALLAQSKNLDTANSNIEEQDKQKELDRLQNSINSIDFTLNNPATYLQPVNVFQ